MPGAEALGQLVTHGRGRGTRAGRSPGIMQRQRLRHVLLIALAARVGDVGKVHVLAGQGVLLLVDSAPPLGSACSCKKQGKQGWHSRGGCCRGGAAATAVFNGQPAEGTQQALGGSRLAMRPLEARWMPVSRSTLSLSWDWTCGGQAASVGSERPGPHVWRGRRGTLACGVHARLGESLPWRGRPWCCAARRLWPSAPPPWSAGSRGTQRGRLVGTIAEGQQRGKHVSIARNRQCKIGHIRGPCTCSSSLLRASSARAATSSSLLVCQPLLICAQKPGNGCWLV